MSGGSNGGVCWNNSSIPQSLDQLLERQWEQGSQFLMEQAQHFDSQYFYLILVLLSPTIGLTFGTTLF
jgi:hypothetical protein